MRNKINIGRGKTISDNCIICGKYIQYFLSNPKKTCSKECCQKYRSIQRKGKKLSEETKNKISQSCMGRPSAMKGRKQSEKAKTKLSIARKGKYTRETNPNWKGGIAVNDIKKYRSFIQRRREIRKKRKWRNSYTLMGIT